MAGFGWGVGRSVKGGERCSTITVIVSVCCDLKGWDF